MNDAGNSAGYLCNISPDVTGKTEYADSGIYTFVYNPVGGVVVYKSGGIAVEKVLSAVSGGTHDLKTKISNYSKLTTDNFFMRPVTLSYHGRTWEHGADYPQPWDKSGNVNFSMSYDPSSGTLKLNGLSGSVEHHTGGWSGMAEGSQSVDVYVVK